MSKSGDSRFRNHLHIPLPLHQRHDLVRKKKTPLCLQSFFRIAPLPSFDRLWSLSQRSVCLFLTHDQDPDPHPICTLTTLRNFHRNAPSFQLSLCRQEAQKTYKAETCPSLKDYQKAAQAQNSCLLPERPVKVDVVCFTKTVDNVLCPSLPLTNTSAVLPPPPTKSQCGTKAPFSWDFFFRSRYAA